VCVEDDIIAIFRLTSREMRLWRKFPEFIPFPPLPMLDRQIRVSGCVVASSSRRIQASTTAASSRRCVPPARVRTCWSLVFGKLLCRDRAEPDSNREHPINSIVVFNAPLWNLLVEVEHVPDCSFDLPD
jgi:hypothetical protein